MRGLEFPIIGTKVSSKGRQASGRKGLKKKFDLSSPRERKNYFEAKVGDEIAHIRKYFDSNSFIAYFLGKKNSGKGTYSKLFIEIFGEERIVHVSVGDLVRDVHGRWKSFVNGKDYERLKSLYRGYISFEECEEALLGQSVTKLLPTEFILALLKLYIDKLPRKTIFIDGLPRGIDQVSYSLYFRDLINYRDDTDLFILIDIPETVIEERMKYRRVCPICQTSRNTKLLITSKVEFDDKDKDFYLVCDNPNCKGARMVEKEGGDLGLEAFRERLDRDEELIKTAFKLHGVPKVLLRNHIPVVEAKKYFDDYEITPEYSFKWDSRNKKVRVEEKPWTVYDDNGVESFSLLAPPVVVGMLKQLVEVLNL